MITPREGLTPSRASDKDMPAYQAFHDPDDKRRKPFSLPPDLDMGLVKAEDLQFDVALEASRLRMAATSRPALPP